MIGQLRNQTFRYFLIAALLLPNSPLLCAPRHVGPTSHSEEDSIEDLYRRLHLDPKHLKRGDSIAELLRNLRRLDRSPFNDLFFDQETEQEKILQRRISENPVADFIQKAFYPDTLVQCDEKPDEMRNLKKLRKIPRIDELPDKRNQLERYRRNFERMESESSRRFSEEESRMPGHPGDSIDGIIEEMRRRGMDRNIDKDSIENLLQRLQRILGCDGLVPRNRRNLQDRLKMLEEILEKANVLRKSFEVLGDGTLKGNQRAADVVHELLQGRVSRTAPEQVQNDLMTLQQMIERYQPAQYQVGNHNWMRRAFTGFYWGTHNITIYPGDNRMGHLNIYPYGFNLHQVFTNQFFRQSGFPIAQEE